MRDPIVMPVHSCDRLPALPLQPSGDCIVETEVEMIEVRGSQRMIRELADGPFDRRTAVTGCLSSPPSPLSSAGGARVGTSRLSRAQHVSLRLAPAGAWRNSSEPEGNPKVGWWAKQHLKAHNSTLWRFAHKRCTRQIERTEGSQLGYRAGIPGPGPK